MNPIKKKWPTPSKRIWKEAPIKKAKRKWSQIQMTKKHPHQINPAIPILNNILPIIPYITTREDAVHPPHQLPILNNNLHMDSKRQTIKHIQIDVLIVNVVFVLNQTAIWTHICWLVTGRRKERRFVKYFILKMRRLKYEYNTFIKTLKNIYPLKIALICFHCRQYSPKVPPKPFELRLPQLDAIQSINSFQFV